MTTIDETVVRAMARAAFERHQRQFDLVRTVDWENIGPELRAVWVENIRAALDVLHAQGYVIQRPANTGSISLDSMGRWRESELGLGDEMPAERRGAEPAGYLDPEAPRPIPVTPGTTGLFDAVLAEIVAERNPYDAGLPTQVVDFNRGDAIKAINAFLDHFRVRGWDVQPVRRRNTDAGGPLPMRTGVDPGRPGGDDHIEVDVELDGKGGVARILDVREHFALRQDEVPAQTHGVVFRENPLTGYTHAYPAKLSPVPTSRIRLVQRPPSPPTRETPYETHHLPVLQQWWITSTQGSNHETGFGGEWRDVPVVTA